MHRFGINHPSPKLEKQIIIIPKCTFQLHTSPSERTQLNIQIFSAIKPSILQEQNHPRKKHRHFRIRTTCSANNNWALFRPQMNCPPKICTNDSKHSSISTCNRLSRKINSSRSMNMNFKSEEIGNRKCPSADFVIENDINIE